MLSLRDKSKREVSDKSSDNDILKKAKDIMDDCFKEGKSRLRRSRVMRKIIEAANYDVSALFNLPDEEESGADYGRYIQASKEYKELVKLLKKYHIEGDSTYKISMGSGHFRAMFKSRYGTINMDESGYTITLKNSFKILNDKDLDSYIKDMSGIKEFADSVMKLNLDDMDSPEEY